MMYTCGATLVEFKDPQTPATADMISLTSVLWGQATIAPNQ